MIRLLSRAGGLAGLALITPAAFGAAGAVAKASHPAKHPAKTKTTRVSCVTKTTDQVDSSGAPVVTSAESGSQYGNVGCGKLLGSGVVATKFTTNASGDLSGSTRWFFNTGTVRATFQLIQDDAADPTTGSFTSVSYTGTIKVLGGTGTDAGVKGTGTEVCTSADSQHLSCVVKLKVG